MEIPRTPHAWEQFTRQYFNGGWKPVTEPKPERDPDHDSDESSGSEDGGWTNMWGDRYNAAGERVDDSESGRKLDINDIHLNYRRRCLRIRYEPCECYDDAMEEAAKIIQNFYAKYPQAPRLRRIKLDWCTNPLVDSDSGISKFVFLFRRPGLRRLTIILHDHSELPIQIQMSQWDHDIDILKDIAYNGEAGGYGLLQVKVTDASSNEIDEEGEIVEYE